MPNVLSRDRAWMTGFIKRLRKDRRGNTLAIAAACLPLVVGAAGLATDTIQWTLWKRQLQRAADSAAIAGVYDRSSSSGSTSTVSATVSHDLTLNNHTWMTLTTGYPQVAFPANSGVMTNQVQVTVAVQQSLPFSSLFVSTAPTIIARSTAASVPSGGDACVNARETNASKTGINNTGNAGIYMPDCVMYSNSPSTNSAAAGGSSNVTAAAVAAVGGIQQSNNWHVQAYRPYSPPIDDPFANVTPDPNLMHCVGSQLDQGTNVTAAITSGTNCWSSLRVNSNTSLTLPDGIYYINGGDAFIQGDITCGSCTIVLTNTSTAANPTIGQFKVNAGSLINLTAPTSGTYKGIAIYQDRRAQDSNQTNKVNGNSSSVITGALYFPSQELDYNGSGNTTAVCTMFVARRITFSGNSATTNKFKSMSQCGVEGLPSGGAIRSVRLVA
jgi:Flp pilus assembly protein TadG